jgi:agmatine/peptidylarginine deiminase
MLVAAERHVAQATTIGWPALAQSWKRDAERIRARMAQFNPESVADA